MVVVAAAAAFAVMVKAMGADVAAAAAAASGNAIEIAGNTIWNITVFHKGAVAASSFMLIVGAGCEQASLV